MFDWINYATSSSPCLSVLQERLLIVPVLPENAIITNPNLSNPTESQLIRCTLLASNWLFHRGPFRNKGKFELDYGKTMDKEK